MCVGHIDEKSFGYLNFAFSVCVYGDGFVCVCAHACVFACLFISAQHAKL